MKAILIALTVVMPLCASCAIQEDSADLEGLIDTYSCEASTEIFAKRSHARIDTDISSIHSHFTDYMDSDFRQVISDVVERRAEVPGHTVSRSDVYSFIDGLRRMLSGEDDNEHELRCSFFIEKVAEEVSDRLELKYLFEEASIGSRPDWLHSNSWIKTDREAAFFLLYSYTQTVQ